VATPTSTSNRCWKLWRTCLTQLVGSNEQGILFQPHAGIGSLNWNWAYSPSTQLLYNINGFIAHRKLDFSGNRRQRMRSFQFHQAGTTCNMMVLPTDGINVSVCTQRDKIVIDGYGQQRPIDITVVDTPTLNLFEAVTGDITHLRNAFTAGKLILLSDGSVKNGIGAADWIITSKATCTSHCITGSLRTTGTPADQSSHRAECFGILGGGWYNLTNISHNGV
jgi:hypothetical protein